MKGVRRHLSYANVVATASLFLVVAGGAAFAVSKLKKDSVKSKHIGDGQVKTADLADLSVTAAKVEGDDIQLRVGGGCSAGESIRTINRDGTVLCESDDLDGFSSTDFLKVSDVAGGDLSGPFSALQLGASAVGAPEVANASLTGTELADVNGADDVNADRVDGAHICDRTSIGSSASFVPICSSGNLILEARCVPSPGPTATGEVRLRTTAGAFQAAYRLEGAVAAFDADFRQTDGPVTVLSDSAGAAGDISGITRFHAIGSSNSGLTGSVALWTFAFTDTIASCSISLSAVATG